MASNITLHIQNNETISEMFTRTKMNTSTINTVCDEIMKEIFSMNNQLRNIPLNTKFKRVFPKIYDILLKHIKHTKLTGNNLTYKEIAKQIMKKMDKNDMSIINGTHYSKSLNVNNAYGSIDTSGRFSNAFRMPQISSTIHKGLIVNNAKSLVLHDHINNGIRPSPFMDNKDLLGMGKPQFAIGDYRKEYDGYRKATKADVTKLTFQTALVKAHQEGGGWPLLEESLNCFRALRVADGLLMIDEQPVAKVGWNENEHAQGVYPAMNYKTEVPWTTVPPKLGNNWTFSESGGTGNVYWTFPCLFVHKSYNEAQGGGSRRSRKHKRSNYIKKQKKRTRKH